jgi:hypothetical protein
MAGDMTTDANGSSHAEGHGPSDRSGPLPPAQKLWLAAEILVSYVQVRRAMPRAQLPQVVETLRASPNRRLARRPLSAGVGDAPRLGAAVDRVLSLLPVEILCLARALVLLRVLARRGIRGSLVIAVLPGVKADFSAHAWVELNGAPLLRPAEPAYGRLLTL